MGFNFEPSCMSSPGMKGLFHFCPSFRNVTLFLYGKVVRVFESDFVFAVGFILG